MTRKKSCPNILESRRIEAAETTFSHPWNPASEITGTHISQLAGLERTGLSLVRVAPGKESFAYHLHHREEEWIYVLAGRGVAIIAGNDYEVEAGDFLAFPTPSVPHQMTNPFAEDLVYLMGGENRKFDVADFPNLDKRMIRLGTDIRVYRLSDGEPFPEP